MTKPRVPLGLACISRISSPVSSKPPMVEIMGMPAPTVASCQRRSGIMRISWRYWTVLPESGPLLESTRKAPPLMPSTSRSKVPPCTATSTTTRVNSGSGSEPSTPSSGSTPSSAGATPRRPEHPRYPRRRGTSPRYRGVRASVCALPERSGRPPFQRAPGPAGLSPAASRYLFAGEVSCGWDQTRVQRPQRLEAHVGGDEEHEPCGRDAEVLYGDARLAQATPAAGKVLVVRRADADDHGGPSLATVRARYLHGHVLPERHATNAGPGVEARDVRARTIGRERVAHEDLDAGLGGWLHGPGMQHFRAEPGEGACLPVREARHQVGVGDQARVCIEHAVHVGHDPDLIRVERPPQYRRR